MLLSSTASENEILFYPRKPSLQLLGFLPHMRCTDSHLVIITSCVLYISLTDTFPIAYLFPGAAVIDSHKLKWLGSLTGPMSETAPLS